MCLIIFKYKTKLRERKKWRLSDDDGESMSRQNLNEYDYNEEHG